MSNEKHYLSKNGEVWLIKSDDGWSRVPALSIYIDSVEEVNQWFKPSVSRFRKKILYEAESLEVALEYHNALAMQKHLLKQLARVNIDKRIEVEMDMDVHNEPTISSDVIDMDTVDRANTINFFLSLALDASSNEYPDLQTALSRLCVNMEKEIHVYATKRAVITGSF